MLLVILIAIPDWKGWYERRQYREAEQIPIVLGGAAGFQLLPELSRCSTQHTAAHQKLPLYSGGIAEPVHYVPKTAHEARMHVMVCWTRCAVLGLWYRGSAPP